jgi:hypothetical protein
MMLSRRSLVMGNTALKNSRPLLGPDLLGGDAFDFGPSRHRQPPSCVLIAVTSARTLYTTAKNCRVLTSAYPTMKMPDDPYFEFVYSKVDKFENRTAMVRTSHKYIERTFGCVGTCLGAYVSLAVQAP